MRRGSASIRSLGACVFGLVVLLAGTCVRAAHGQDASPSPPPSAAASSPAPLPALPRIPRTPPATLPVPHDAAWPPAGPWRVEDAVSLAVNRTPSLKAAVAEVEARIARIHQTASGTKPKVELHYSATRYEQPLGIPFSTDIVGNNVTIQAAPFTLSQFEDRLHLTQLISDGGRTRLLVAADIESARTALAQLLSATLDLQHEVRLAWLAVLEARAQVGVAQETLASVEAHLAMARAQFEAGVVARADVTYSETPVTRARLALHNTRTAVMIQTAHLLSTMGLDPADALPEMAEPALPDPGLDLPALRASALRDRPDLAARAHESAAAVAALDAAGRSRSVQIQGAAGVRQVGYQTAEIVPVHPGWTASLEVSYPLIDGGLISGQVAEARARARAAVERQNQLTRTIDEQVVTRWHALAESKERLTLADAEVAQAATSLEVAQGQYQAGVGTNLQVLDAQVALARARVDAVNARYAESRARADLLHAVGR